MFGAMKNSNMPRPAKGGVIGPPKLQMPDSGGGEMPRMNSDMQKSSLGPKLKPLPRNPFHSMRGTSNSLIQSQTKKSASTSGVGLDGIL